MMDTPTSVGAAEPGVRYSLNRVRGGGWKITVTRGPASSSTTALAPLTRPRLAAPPAEIWQHGENLRSSRSALQTLWSRELRIGGERSDIALPGEQDAFGETLQEYLPLLFCAIEADRGGTLRRLLELGVNANGYFCGQTPIGGAAALGRIELVRILHAHGADFNLPWVTSDGDPVLLPLHAAAFEGHSSVVRYLLDHGADVELPREARREHDGATRRFEGTPGSTAAWLACLGGHHSTVVLLHSRGARLDAPDDYGWTPLHAACCEGHDEIVHFLIEKGISVKPNTRSVDTPLTLACWAGHCEIVRVLHAAGADLKRGTSDGKPEGTPYALAFRQGRRDVVNYLESCGVRHSSGASVGRGRVRLPDSHDGPEFDGHARATTSPPSSPQPKQSRPKRATPLRDRAAKVGVSDKLKATPPGVRQTIRDGSPSSSEVKAAKKLLQTTQVANHQIVSRAELKLPRNSEQKKASTRTDNARKRAKRRDQRTYSDSD